MTPVRFNEITDRYAHLRVAVLGDFCLDRYLEIDPGRTETSIETGRPVHNVSHVRFQPGGAGTILNNLSAIGIGEIIPIGFCGRDAEGHELHDALARHHGANLNHFLCTPERRTFTYCKPLLMHAGEAPEELNRLDFKNWTPTPSNVIHTLIDSLATVLPKVDAVMLLDQVDEPETGVINATVLQAVGELAAEYPQVFFLGDSRRGFADWPHIAYKMNGMEFSRFEGLDNAPTPDRVLTSLGKHAQRLRQPQFVTLAADGIVSANKDGEPHHEPALPTEGKIDIVGAGDAVSANLAGAMAAGANPAEAATIANHAASVVIHKLGTTGTATVEEIHNKFDQPA